MEKEKRVLAILMMLYFFSPAFGQFEYFDPILSETASDGHILYDRHFMPKMTDMQRMNLKGNVQVLIEDHNLKGGQMPRAWSDTISFHDDGNYKIITMPKTDFFNENLKLRNTIYSYKYENGRLIKSLKGEDIVMADGKEYRIDATDFSYAGSSDLLTEKHSYYTYKGKKGELDSNQPTSSNWRYSYNIDQKIATGTTRDGSDNAIYTNELLTEWRYVGGNVRPTKFSYDSNGRMISISRYEYEGRFCEVNYQISRNDQGDITKVVWRNYKTNSKGVRIKQQKPQLVETYNVNYAYDQYGNWINAVVTAVSSGKKTTYYTIKRTINYK